jgi:DHA1 family bicyclomycin/chloramphenicol resistance-like MFS transporter
MQAPSAAPVHPIYLTVLTGLLFSVGPVTVDLSLPTLPYIQQAIGTPALRAELNLTTIFLGMFAAQFAFGAVADRYGRKWPMLIGMMIYCVASFAASLAPHMTTFLLARTVQALAYGVAVVLARCVVVDVCEERQAARVFSTAVMLMSVASVAAPALGGVLLEHLGWRAVFAAMGMFGAVTLIAALGLSETLPTPRRTRVPFTRVLSTYGSLLRQRRFASYTLIGAGAVALQFTYNTGSPAVIIEHYGLLPATAGILFSAIALSMAISSQANAILLRWFTPEQLMTFGATLSCAAAAALLANVLTGIGAVPAFTATLFVLIATIGFIAPNAMAGAISSAGDKAGAASALVGVIQFLFGSIGSALVSVFHDTLGRPMSLVIASLSLGTLLVCLAMRRSPGALPA